MTGTRPLDGVLVVAMEQAAAGPFATRRLAGRCPREITVDGGDLARGFDTEHIFAELGVSNRKVSDS